MGPLWSGERAVWSFADLWSGRRDGNGHDLRAQQAEPLAPGLPAAPVSPQDWTIRRMGREQTWRGSSAGDGPEDSADAARLAGSGSMSLTVLRQRTGATVAEPSSIQDAYRAIPLRSPLLRVERLTCWTAQGAVGLWCEVCSIPVSGCVVC
jgi:hypothetical protein